MEDREMKGGRERWREGGCQTVRINSAAPLSSTDGVASIFCLFCQNNVLKVGVGVGVGACPPVPSHTNLQVCGGAQLSSLQAHAGAAPLVNGKMISVFSREING